MRFNQVNIIFRKLECSSFYNTQASINYQDLH